MKRMIYIVKEDRIHGDGYDMFYSFDHDEAVQKAWFMLHYLTPRELKETVCYVEGRMCEYAEGQSAKDAAREESLDGDAFDRDAETVTMIYPKEA